MDGLRGLAILMVIVFHYNLRVASTGPLIDLLNRFTTAGGAGVNLFFILSGFLITGILLDTKSDSHYLRNFFARRFLRIFPLYYGTLFVGLVLLPMLYPISDAKYLSTVHHQIWLWIYCSNIYESFSGRAMPLFGHFWSLAVEEHFYLIWPFVVLWTSKRTLAVICVGCFVTAFLVRYGLLEAGANPALAVLRLTPCQMDNLAVGALLALLMRSSDRSNGLSFPVAAWACGLCCLIIGANIMGFPLLSFGSPFAFALFNSVWAILFGSLLLLAVTSSPSFWIRRILEMPWLRMIGKYSYALYVFHWPIGRLVLQVMERRWQIEAASPQYGFTFQAIYFASAFSLSLLCAWLSWHLYEKHFLNLKDFFSYQNARAGEITVPSVSLPKPILHDRP